jgi:uncharacterized YigZ family protein
MEDKIISQMPANRYPVPAGEIRREILVINSRFVASLAPAFSVDEARAFINRVKSEMPDASHHVPAFIIGSAESVITHCSDAGEPSGTAGRPALAVLQGSGLGDVVVVVTRYFGGTRLGTGGLVRAYSDAVRAVLADVRRAERVPTHTIMLELPYSLLERARRLVAAHAGHLMDEDYTASVVITALLPIERLPGFQTELSELSNGSIQAEIIETGEMLVPIQ